MTKQMVEMIKAEYAPYHKMREFQQGYDAYMNGNMWNEHDCEGVAAQAWDRGANAAMRISRGEG